MWPWKRKAPEQRPTQQVFLYIIDPNNPEGIEEPITNPYAHMSIFNDVLVQSHSLNPLNGRRIVLCLPRALLRDTILYNELQAMLLDMRIEALRP